MKKLFALLTALFAVVSLTFAQGSAIIEFKETGHDFGGFKEESGKKKHRFIFTNKGTSPLIVTNVQASCGCTTPGWSKQPVPPGKTGYVEAEYDPTNRPGEFNKSLTVTNNSSNQPSAILTIKGKVTEREKSAADLYPRKIGDLRLASEYLNVGMVGPGKVGVASFKVLNEADKAVTFTGTNNLPKHIKVEFIPATLKKGQAGDIKLTYDAANKKDYGYVNDPFEITYSGGTTDRITVYGIATIEDSPKKLSGDELKKAPRLSFNTKSHDFGVLKPGEVVEYEFKLINSGGSALKIHKTKASCGCTASQPDKYDLAPGESSNIKVTFNSTGKHDGPQSQTVTIYSNDPTEPTQYISINAKIDSKKETTSPVVAPKGMLREDANKK